MANKSSANSVLTCKQLIKRLRDFPPDQELYIETPARQLVPVKGADIVLGRNRVMIHSRGDSE